MVEVIIVFFFGFPAAFLSLLQETLEHPLEEP